MNATSSSRTRRGDEPLSVRAVEVGTKLLRVLLTLDQPANLKTLAESAGMPPPKALRYLVAMRRSGMVRMDASAGTYGLGDLAVQIGLSALRRLDVVEAASRHVAALRDALGFSAGLAVWGTHGPSFVQVEDGTDVALITVRVGAVMPIVTSATGRVFGAYLPSTTVGPLVDAELKRPRLGGGSTIRTPPTRRDVAAMFKEVRERATGRVTGEMNAGVHALAVPIFNHVGAMVGALSALGAAGAFDATLDGPIAMALRRSATDISARLGCVHWPADARQPWPARPPTGPRA